MLKKKCDSEAPVSGLRLKYPWESSKQAEARDDHYREQATAVSSREASGNWVVVGGVINRILSNKLRVCILTREGNVGFLWV